MHVVFDVGGVLLRWDPHALVREFLDDPCNDSEAAALVAATRSATWRALDNGTAQPPTRFPGVCERHTASFCATFHEYMPRMREGWELVEQVRANGHRLAILSNFHRGAWKAVHHQFEGHFDSILVSSRIGVSKPDALVFDALLAELQCDASEVVFIDDTLENCEAARRAGIVAVHYVDPAAAREDLVRVGVLTPPSGPQLVLQALRLPAFAAILALKIVESAAYFAMSLAFALFLTEQFGFGDVAAGTLYGVWGLAISVWGLFTGFLVDRLGVRRSFALGALVTGLGRVLFAVAPSRPLLYVAMILLVPAGSSLLIPVLTIAVKHASPPHLSSVCFGLFYSAMNVGAIFAGLLVDAAGPERYRALFVCCGVATLLCGAFAYRWLAIDAPAARPLSSQREDEDEDGGGGGDPSFVSQAKEALRSPVFWRIAVYTLVMLFVNSIFRHVDGTFPKFATRAIRGGGDRFGLVYSINPAIIIVLVPVAQSLLARFDIYNCLVVGSLLTAASPGFLFFGGPYFSSSVAFMVCLSIGEAIYSPRSYEFVLAASPTGKEGVFGSLAAAPRFMVSLLVGTMSGGLLEEFCPAPPAAADPARCLNIWLVVALTAMVTPVGLLALRRYLNGAEMRAAKIERQRVV